MNDIDSLFTFVCFHNILLKDVNEGLSRWSINRLCIQIKDDPELRELAIRCANLISLNKDKWPDSDVTRALNHETDAYAWFSGAQVSQIKISQVKYLLTAVSEFQNSIMRFNLRNLKFS